MTLLVAPGSLAALPSPATLPVERRAHVYVVESTVARVVVRRDEITTIAGRRQESSEQYVLDRHSAANLVDPRAWTGTPSTTVDRSPAHSSAAFGFDPAARVEVWKDEVARSYPYTRIATDISRDGLDLDRYRGELRGAALTPAATTDLATLGLPTAIDTADLTARFPAAATALDQLRRTLPAIDTADRDRLARALPSTQTPLTYLLDVTRQVLVEPATGIVVGAETDEQTVSALPTALIDISQLLANAPYLRRGDLAGLRQAVNAAAPIPVIRSSVTGPVAVPARVRAAEADLAALTTTVPAGLGIAAAVSLVAAAALAVVTQRRRRTAAPATLMPRLSAVHQPDADSTASRVKSR